MSRSRFLNCILLGSTLNWISSCFGTKPFPHLGAVESPELPVSICGHHLTALFDTGSRNTLISASFAKGLKINNDALLPPPSTELFTATLSPLKITNTARLRISLPGTTINTFFDFLVVEDLDTEIILGTDFMAAMGASINVAKKTITFNPNDSFKPSRSWSFNLTTNAPMKIEPKSEKVFHIPVSNISSNKPVLVEGLHPPDGFAMESGIVQPVRINDHWHVPIIAANLTSGTKTIPRKSIIATITSHDKIQIHPLDKTLEVKNGKSAISDVSFLDDFNLSTVPISHLSKLKSLLLRFKDIFSSGPTDIGHCTSLPHEIKLRDPSKIVNIAPYRLPHNLMSVVHEYVDKLLEAGVIRHSTSPFSSPIMLVRKAGADPRGPLTSTYRVVHNYTKINQNLDTCSYPLRNIQELLDEVASAKVRSIFDLSQGFFNQTLKDPAGATAFSVPGRGLFQYSRSPMGIASSPAYFQRLLDFVLRGLSKSWAYLDDVVIVSENWDEHLTQLEAAFSRFRTHHLKLNKKKVQLGKATVDFLGWTINNEDGIRPGERKIECIKKALPPRSVTEIKQFLGLCGFFRRCVQNFSQIASPLNALVRKGSGYTKGPLPKEARQAFEDIKSALISRPCLSPVNYNLPFILTVDSSMSGHGAILSQIHSDGVERPCAYASASLSDPEKRKPAFQREKEGIRWGLRKFQAYLHAANKTIRSDHLPLKSLANGKVDVTDSVSADILNFLPFTVEYIPGKIIPADYLSRLPTVNAIQPSKAKKGALKSPLPEELQPHFIQSRGHHWSAQLLLDQQRLDPECKALFIYFKTKEFPKKRELASFVSTMRTGFRLDDTDGLIKDKQERVFVPTSLRTPLMERAHDQWGHRGTSAVLDMLCPHYVWPLMRKNIEDHIKSCVVCAQAKPGPLTRLPLKPLPIPEHFNGRLHLDCLTNLPLNPFTLNRHILIIVDSFTGFLMAKPLQTLQASEVLSVLLDDWLPHHGLMDSCSSDSGSEFSPKLVNEIADALQIEWHWTTPSHSMSNSPAERAIRSLLTFVRTYIQSLKVAPTEWESYLAPFALIHNSLRNNRGFSPLELVQGLQPRLPFLPLAQRRINHSDDPFIGKLNHLIRISKIAKEKLEMEKRTNKRFYDQHLCQPRFQPGGLAYVLNNRGYSGKLDRPYQGPFLITKVDDPYLLLQSLDDTSAPPFKRHQNSCRLGFLRHYTPSSDVAVRDADQQGRRRQVSKLAVPPETASDEEGAFTSARDHAVLPAPGHVLSAAAAATAAAAVSDQVGSSTTKASSSTVSSNRAHGSADTEHPPSPDVHAHERANSQRRPHPPGRDEAAPRSRGLFQAQLQADVDQEGASDSERSHTGGPHLHHAAHHRRSTRAHPGELVPMRFDPDRPPNDV